MKALRRTVMVLRDGVLWPVAVVDAVLGGVFGGGQPEVVEDVVEDATGEAAVEHQAEKAVAEQLTMSSRSLGAIAKRACACRDADMPMHGLFMENDPLHRNLRTWLEGLSESSLRLIRYMPSDTLDRHLDPREAFRASGLPPFSAAPIAMVEPQADPSPQIETPKRKRSRATVANLADSAFADGRAPTLSDLLAHARTMR